MGQIKLKLRGRLRFLRRSQKEEIERRKEGSVVCTYSDLRGRERTKKRSVVAGETEEGRERQRQTGRESVRRNITTSTEFSLVQFSSVLFGPLRLKVQLGPLIKSIMGFRFSF